MTRSWTPSTPWPLDWPGEPPALSVRGALLVWVGKGRTTGAVLAHFRRADGTAGQMRLSEWRRKARQNAEPHGKVDLP